MKISTLIETISVKTGYQAMLVAAGEAEKDRLENIGELVSTAAQYEENTENPTISEFLEDVALVTDIDRYDDTADAVVLMTIHAAKGLEFKNVFLPGWEEGIFPGFQSIMNPEEIEEERRLAYVAMTRAQKRLYITHVHQRMLNGSTLYNQESRFLREVPEWLCEEKDTTLSSFGATDAYSYGKRMPSRAGANPIYNHSAPGAGWGTGEERAAYTGNVPRPRQSTMPKVSGIGTTPTAKKPAVETFDKGDRVRHTTFGTGVITDVKSMGGDVLYTIEFEKVSTKKLMASFARLKKD